MAYHSSFGAQSALGGGMAYLKNPPYHMNLNSMASLGSMGHHSPMDHSLHPSAVPYPQGEFAYTFGWN